MTERGALQMITAFSLALGKDIDPALVRVWTAVLPEVPDDDIRDLTAKMLRESRFMPAPSEVLAAWRDLTQERRAARARAELEAGIGDPYLAMSDEEYDRIAIPPPPEARAAMKRLGLPIPKEAA